ncbi:MAG: penicillin-binding protein 2 [Acidobacteriota bacterium]|nr:penicillin-binding protein 2 [Acidobacteriota bacterium]NLT32279.1 penicillin-binding protein 2 [Acidobacteriota bacterium]
MALEQESNRQLIQRRLNLFRIPVLLIFVVLGARLWQLQIIQGSEYALKAERNRIRNITLVAPRGNILDRNGVPLVDSRPSFDVLLYREDMKDRAATVRFLTQKLGIDPEEVERQFERHRGTGLYRPFIVKEDAQMKDISVIEAHRRDHPEIKVVPEPRRQYRYGTLAAHLLGYLGEISEEELKSKRFPGVEAGRLVGRSGVERFYDRLLAGKDGRRQVLVDSVGREVGILDESEPVIGGEMRLTLDLRLQVVAEDALRGKVGVVAAMDPRNGEILALASSPSFDPNSFSRRISGSDWNELVRHPDRPMQNRAIQNSHSPGSIFKLIMAGAGFGAGMLDNDPAVVCRGGASYYGRVFHCANRSGHGALRLEQAIAKSCNIYFYELGRNLGIERISEFARSLGLGSPSGIDLPGERGGIMPSPEWKLETRGARWYPGETISVAIGQGAVSTTPVQLLRAVSALVTAGRLVTPHVLLRAEGDAADQPGRWPVRILPIEEAHARKIRQGMWESVNAWGTGHNAAVPGEDICGKTGTAQVVGKEARERMKEGLEDHAWFAGFGSRDHPEIAVVVFVEHGGSGGGAAAPIAREIFRTYYLNLRSPGADGND